MFGDYQLSLHDYLSILRRRALAMILTFVLVLAASVVLAFVLPRVYESTATILVEGPQVKMAVEEGASRPRPEDRVNLIRQRLKAPVIFDGRNLYDAERLARAGFQYFPMGRGDSRSLPISQHPRANADAT